MISGRSVIVVVPMLDLLTFVLAAVAAIVVLQYLADKTGLPAAALLTVAGLVYAVTCPARTSRSIRM